jgi:hypothetical protein
MEAEELERGLLGDLRRVCLGVSEEEMESESSNHRAPSLCWWFVMAAHRCNAIYTIDAIRVRKK